MMELAVIWAFMFNVIGWPSQIYVTPMQAECEKVRAYYDAQGYNVSASCARLDLAVLPSSGLLF